MLELAIDAVCNRMDNMFRNATVLTATLANGMWKTFNRRTECSKTQAFDKDIRGWLMMRLPFPSMTTILRLRQ